MSLPLTPAQARAAAAVVAVRARDVPSLKPVAAALWEWADEHDTETDEGEEASACA